MNTQSTNAQAGRRTEFVGAFIKASGAVRTMRFTTSPDKLRSGGLITVFDVEKRSLRKFNLTTLVGRLTAFAPGVSGTTRLGNAGQNNANNFMVDGVSIMDTGNNGQMLQTNVDAIAEVKVLTSGYQAEY